MSDLFPFDPMNMFGEGFLGRGMQGFNPSVTMRETEENVIVTVNVPGAKSKDIQVQIYDNGLTVAGKVSVERKEEQDGAYRVERSMSTFTRSIGFPCPVLKKQARAVFENGILTVTVPKQEKGKLEILPVQIEELRKAREREAAHTEADEDSSNASGEDKGDA